MFNLLLLFCKNYIKSLIIPFLVILVSLEIYECIVYFIFVSHKLIHDNKDGTFNDPLVKEQYVSVKCIKLEVYCFLMLKVKYIDVFVQNLKYISQLYKIQNGLVQELI